MLTELQLCEKRRHKASIRYRRRSPRGRSQGGHYRVIPYQQRESWVLAEADRAMQAGLLMVLLSNAKSFFAFTPRRGR